MCKRPSVQRLLRVNRFCVQKLLDVCVQKLLRVKTSLCKTFLYVHKSNQSLPIFSGPMHVRRECALSDVLNPKKLRRLAEGKSAFKTGRTVLTINLMTAISQTTIEKCQIFPIAQWQHIKDLETHPSHHSLKPPTHISSRICEFKNFLHTAEKTTVALGARIGIPDKDSQYHATSLCEM